MNISDALEMAGETDAGMIRDLNEDSINHNAAIGLFILADGMGGYNAGEVASGIAASIICTDVSNTIENSRPEEVDPFSGEDIVQSSLRRGIEKCNTSIFNTAQSQTQFKGMGTTIIAALFHDNRVCVAHVGDSRMYRFRDGLLETITKDHTLLQQQIDDGIISKEDSAFSKNKNMVTRAVGIASEVEVELHTHDVKVGDIYLLCSDGLNDMINDIEISSIIEELQKNLPGAASQLIKAANSAGGRDNVSVMLIKVKKSFSTSNWRSKFFSWLNQH